MPEPERTGRDPGRDPRLPLGDGPADAFIEALLDDDVVDLYENAPCGFLSTTPDGTILKVNRTLLHLLGYDRHELIGAVRFEQLLSPGGRIYHETHYAPMLRMESSAREIAFDMVRKDGSRVAVLVNSIVKHDGEGAPVAVRTAVFDATDRREYERELLRARDAARDAEHRARELAATLQASLIPPDPPSIRGLDVAAAYRPAGAGDEVGGDFYDVFEAGRNDWAIVLGDVCGKGAEAATVTALARYTVRASAARSRRPRTILQELNDALIRQGSERFCTVVYARIRLSPDRVRVTVGSGGHWLPLRVTPDREVSAVGRTGTILGVIGDPQLGDATVDLRPGETLVFFTDGVVEARRGADVYDHDRLEALLAGLAGRSAGAIASVILEDVLVFQDGLPTDDIAVVVVRVPPAD